MWTSEVYLFPMRDVKYQNVTVTPEGLSSFHSLKAQAHNIFLSTLSVDTANKVNLYLHSALWRLHSSA